MIASLILAAAIAPVPATRPVAEAERSFAAAAQKSGQWTAFRAFAAPDANMLVDGIRPAHAFLAKRKDPPSSVKWWPARTYTSCDGSLAFSTGPFRAGKEHGQYFTIWQRQKDGSWKWIYDGGGPVKTPVAAGDKVQAVRAGCGKPRDKAAMFDTGVYGTAKDGSLTWSVWKMGPNTHRIRVLFVRNGRWEVAQDTRIAS